MDRTQKQKRSAANRRQAGQLLQRLAWLNGYPQDGAWRTALGVPVTVDGALLARTRRAARTLLRKHARALPELVGEVELWWNVADVMLRWCGAHLASGGGAASLAAELLPLLGKRLARTAQAAPPAIVVVWALEPERLERALHWLARHPVASSFDLPLLLRLTYLATQGKDTAAGAAELAELLAVDHAAPYSLEDRRAYVRKRVRAKPRSRAAEPMPKRAPLRPLLLEWLEELCVAPAPRQARALALLVVSGLRHRLEAWQRWEQEQAPLLARALAFADLPPTARVDTQRAMLEQALEQAQQTQPPMLHLGFATSAILQLGSDELAAALPALQRWLEAHPLDRRIEQFLRCEATLRWASRELRAKLAAFWWHVSPSQIATPHRQPTLSWGLEETIVEAMHVDELPRLTQVMKALAKGTIVTERALQLAGLWTGAMPRASVTELVELVELSLPVQHQWHREAVAATVALEPESPTQAIALVEELLRHRDSASVLRAFCLAAAAQGQAWIVRAALERKQGEPLAMIAAAWELLPPAKRPPLATPGPSAWSARYPSELREALERLAAIDPEAEQTAQARLAEDFPEPAALRRELAALKARRPLDERATRRLATLRARLTRPPAPTPQRLRTLARRVDDSAAGIWQALLWQRLRTLVLEHCAERFRLPRLPDWPLDRKWLAVLLGLLQLPVGEAALAARLLRARTGPRPWDLRDERANRDFAANARRRGLVLEPWLDATPRRVEDKNGTIELWLSDDPIEVFAMGAHFQTCLSPGGINFFSVVANAADLNKRVLYARRGDQVVARCLLAITDTCCLLTFHPYCHGGLDFAALVKQFVADLAREMNTTTAPSGRVRPLLANRWYDDGPEDLTGQFEALRKANLNTVAAADLPRRLEELLGRELDDLTLPHVLELRELRQQPELFGALVPTLLRCTVPTTRYLAAGLAYAHGELPLADRLLGTSEPDSIDDFNLERHIPFAHLRPSALLARLRPLDNKNDDPGLSCILDTLAGIALQALHRPRQALERYQRALELSHDLRDLLEPRIRAVTEALNAEPAARR